MYGFIQKHAWRTRVSITGRVQKSPETSLTLNFQGLEKKKQKQWLTPGSSLLPDNTREAAIPYGGKLPTLTPNP